MSQHNLTIANDSGAAVRANLNLALAALGSMMTGAVGSMPKTQSNMLVADTTSGHIIKRNNDDTDWEYLTPIDHRIIASAAGTDSYAITYSPAVNGVKNGVVYRFRADVANTGAATFNPNATGAKTIKRYANNVLATLMDNDIIANMIVDMIYDSTNDVMVLMNPAGPPAGEVVQVVNYSTGAADSATTLLPVDASIPQNTEGDEFLTVSITPKNAANKLLVQVVVNGYVSVAGYSLSAALFQDSIADALCAACATPGGPSGYVIVLPMTHYMTAGTTSEIDFKVRVGPQLAGVTVYMNAAFGGVFFSSITVTEIAG